MSQVADGVHRIPLTLPQDGLQAINVYAIESPAELVLVDAGWAHGPGRSQLAAGLRELGYGLGDISRFLVTHLHYDHYTLAVPLRREFGTPIELPSGERPSLAAIHAPGAQSLTPQMQMLRSHGAADLAASIESSDLMGDIDTAVWEPPDRWIDPGRTIDVGRRRLTALATPGHTTGHLAFADLDDLLLFAGDHVLPHITPSIGFEASGGAFPLRDFLDSLQRVGELPDMKLLPAHGPPADGTHERVRQLLDHHADRLAQTAAAVAGGARSAYEVARRLRWTRHGRHLEQLDAFNRMLATTETVAHLELLAENGDLVRGGDHREPRYTP